jgi:hypothetical protein
LRLLTLRTAWFALLLSLAVASAVIGTLFALDHSQDLQWDEARLFLEGINPYLFHLEPGRPLPDYIAPGTLGLTQMPSAVLLFAPIALPSFETAKILWIVVNFSATPAFVLLAVRLFHLGRLGAFGLAALTLLFVASMPWRIAIGNGQYCLIAMTLFLIALHFYRERRLGLATLFSALALVKYTLVLPFFALFLHRKKDTALVLAGALLIHAGLTVAAGLLVGERPDVLVRQSLTIAGSITEAGAYDLFAFQARVAPELGRAVPIALSALLIALTVSICWGKEVGSRELAALSIVSIVIVYHRSYDAIVLLFLVLHLHELRTRISPRALDLAEFHLGCAILIYVFALDQFVYGLMGSGTHAAITAGFSALLYGYLALLFFRSLSERRAISAEAAPAAANP